METFAELLVSICISGIVAVIQCATELTGEVFFTTTYIIVIVGFTMRLVADYLFKCALSFVKKLTTSLVKFVLEKTKLSMDTGVKIFEKR